MISGIHDGHRARRVDAPDQLRAVAVLPDEHDHAPRGADAEDVEDDRLQRQQQRAERAGEQDERGDPDQREDQREAPVDRVDEVGVGGRRAADADVGPVAWAASRTPVERGAAFVGAAVGGSGPRRRSPSRRGATRGRRARTRRGCRRPRRSAVATFAGSVPPSIRISCGSSAPSPMPESLERVEPGLGAAGLRDRRGVGGPELECRTRRPRARRSSAARRRPPPSGGATRPRPSASRRGWPCRRCGLCGQSSREPEVDSTTGSSVIATTVETSGISIPP